MTHPLRPGTTALVLACVFGLALPTNAEAQLVSASPDVSIALVPGALDPVADQDVAVDNGLGIVLEESLGGSLQVNPGLDLRAYADEGGARRLFALDTAVALLGVVPAAGDLVRFEAGTYSIAFDASLEGVPEGVTIDAVTRGTDGELLLSFDSFVDLGTFTAADEDLVRFAATSGFSLFFDGSAQGVPTTLDLDAASVGETGALFVSFDAGGVIAGVGFSDEDVLEFDPVTASWAGALAFDASNDASGLADAWQLADLDAVQIPEPGFASGLAGTVIALLALARRSARRPIR